MSKIGTLTKRLAKATEAMAMSEMTALLSLIYEDLQGVKQKMLREGGINPTAIYLTAEVSILLSIRKADVLKKARNGELNCIKHLSSFKKGGKVRFLGQHLLDYLNQKPTAHIVELGATG